LLLQGPQLLDQLGYPPDVGPLRRVGHDLTRDLGAERNQLLAGLDGHCVFVPSPCGTTTEPASAQPACVIALRECAGRCYFVSQPNRPPLDAFPLDLPASLRLARQRPLLFRARGCLLPPGLGTWGTLPALRSVIAVSPPLYLDAM
jgi:hypothetical protein